MAYFAVAAGRAASLGSTTAASSTAAPASSQLAIDAQMMRRRSPRPPPLRAAVLHLSLALHSLRPLTSPAPQRLAAAPVELQQLRHLVLGPGRGGDAEAGTAGGLRSHMRLRCHNFNRSSAISSVRRAALIPSVIKMPSQSRPDVTGQPCREANPAHSAYAGRRRGFRRGWFGRGGVVVCGDAVAEDNDFVADADAGDGGDVNHGKVHRDTADDRSLARRLRLRFCWLRLCLRT